jgi:hypothetical protein
MDDETRHTTSRLAAALSARSRGAGGHALAEPGKRRWGGEAGLLHAPKRAVVLHRVRSAGHIAPAAGAR